MSSCDEKTIALGAPTFGEEEIERVRQVLQSGWVAGQGPIGAELEAAFAKVVGVRHAVAVSNCTAALHLCLLGMHVGPGDEVIVADYTFPATGHSVLFVGATPVFVDVLPTTWTVDPGLVEEAIGPRTRGIIAVDTFGQCADHVRLEEIAASHGLFLIEDAAAAAGAEYRGRKAGSFGVAGCFSLHGRKGITSGEGGLITTDDDRLAALLQSIKCFGMESAFARQGRNDLPIPTFSQLGYNYKLSDIQAAVAVEQLKKLNTFLERRAAVANAYADLLEGVAGLALPTPVPDRKSAWQSYVLTLDGGAKKRNRVAMQLRSSGIQANIGTYASHLQPVYRSDRVCPESARLFESHLAIPMHANLSDADVERVCREVRRAMNA